MKRTTLAFVALAMIAVFSAFKSNDKSATLKKFVGQSIVGSKYFIADNPNIPGVQAYEISMSTVEGTHYTCTSEANRLCTVIIDADQVELQWDAVQGLYYVENSEVEEAVTAKKNSLLP